MPRTIDFFRKSVLAGALALTVPATPGSAHAAYRVLYTFQNGNDGGDPYGGVILDSAGNLYGTTLYFGDGTCRCGTVYKIAPDGTETTLHAFKGGSDGAAPYAGLVMDKTGNLYGTTSSGGIGFGTVFKIGSDGSETVLHAFGSGSDGSVPYAGLILDKAGNLYGTTVYGGSNANCGYLTGCGTVFELAPDGTETVLYAFQGGGDGGEPYDSLLRDKAGNLYGTTAIGTVFKIAPDDTETILHTFNYHDGWDPLAGVIMDGAGNLYGTTAYGGSVLGTAFQLAPDGTLTTLHNFTDKPDGAIPFGGLVMDNAGNLYGTTWQGGKNCGFYGSTCGIVFEIAPDGTETVIHRFNRKKGDGLSPRDGLIMDKKGNLYGTTYWTTNAGGGTVFEITR